MKITILLGWAKTDASGNPSGAPAIVSGPPKDDDETREQAAVFHNAKQLRKFPTGIRYLAFGRVEIADAAALATMPEAPTQNLKSNPPKRPA